MTLPRLTFKWTALFAPLVLVMMISSAWLNEAEAGCRLNVYVKNSGKGSLLVLNRKQMPETAVKAKMGVWRGLRQGFWFSGSDTINISTGQTKGDQYDAGFGCGAKRRYRINYLCTSGANKGSDFTDYYPSAKDWTTSQTVTIPLRQCK